MLFIRRKTMFDIIKEEDEETSNTAESETNADNTADEAQSADESGSDGKEDEFGSDDEFDIDTSIDDDSDSGGNDSSSSDTSSSGDNTEEEDTNDDAVENNTNIFSSLTAEEQKIKIMELKNLFANLYNSANDITDKFDNTTTNNNDIETIERLSTVLYSLKVYLRDYIINKFSQRTYIENDIAFNRFLSVFNSINVIIEDMNKQKDQNHQ